MLPLLAFLYLCVTSAIFFVDIAIIFYKKFTTSENIEVLESINISKIFYQKKTLSCCTPVNSIGTIYEDVTSDVLGRMGLWQWLVTFHSTCLLLPSLFNQYEDTFLIQSPSSILCYIPDHYDVVNSSMCTFTLSGNSTEEIKCTKWHVKIMWFIWIKKSWMIFCDQQVKLLATSIVCRMGLLFGCVILGLIADCFGRRKAIMLSIGAEVAFRLIIVFCDSDNWFRLLIFLKSLLGSANYYVALVLVCEIASNTWRTRLLAIVSLPKILAAVCLVALANRSPNQETFDFITFAFEASLLLLLRWTPESPQWLLFNRRIQQTEKLLFQAAKTNRIELCSNFKIRPVNHRAYNCLDRVWTCVELLTTYNIRVIVITLLLFWNVFSFLWSCMYLRVYSSGHHFLLLKIFGFGFIVGLSIVYLSIKLKLKQLLLISILLMGSFNALDIIMKDLAYNDTIRSMFAALALSSGLIGQILIINLTPRLFAINVRATLLGCCQAAGQLGTILGYLLLILRITEDRTLVIIEIALAFLLSGLCYVIPDIDGRELPDVMEDMDYFSELSKPLRWATQKTNSPSKEEVQMRVYSFGSACQNLSGSHSEDRMPARRIGLVKLFGSFRLLLDNLRQK